MNTQEQQLAELLVNYSCRVQPGERIWIECSGFDSISLIERIVEECYKAGGVPFVNIQHERLQRAWLMNASSDAMKRLAKYDAYKMKDMQAYIAVRSPQNAAELADVPGGQKNLYQVLYGKPVNIDIRVKRTKWVVLTYPSPSRAQDAGFSTAAYTDFFYRVCNLDYAKLSLAMDALVTLIQSTDRVRIVSPGTDLTFSVKGIPAVKCDGKCNIPDGEVYTAPIKKSVNGHITFNTPSPFQGFCFENIRLTFKNGKITEACANDTERINKIFDTEPSARYLGEFAFGLNPYITKPTKNILFDEKISGSIHLTPGCCYDDAYNGNKSAIHWDMVLIQTKEYGGGDIYFDDVLIRRDGLFTLPRLFALNPENFLELR